MESLDSLKFQKSELEEQLERITIKKHGSTPWGPGVQDQFKSESYSYKEYTDPKRAYDLKNRIEYLDSQIRTYADRARAERERQEAYIDSLTPNYEYIVAGRKETTKDPALAARYHAQHRFFGMSKFKQTLMRITGQKRKFDRLWNSVGTSNVKKQQEIADELNSMFRR